MASYKQQAERHAKKIGATIHREPDCISVDAPGGKLFEATETHTLIVQGYRQALSEMREGVVDCYLPGCDCWKAKGA